MLDAQRRVQFDERLLFVGSCFADNIGKRFGDDHFDVVVNPYGVMYNPVSVMHSVKRHLNEPGSRVPDVALLTLGTNHVYRLNETGQIVDNCEKRPQSLFTEEELSIDECAHCLQQTIDMLAKANPQVRIILTVSPIRYAKYGFHESQLSKAVLLLAADRVVKANNDIVVEYFPAYEIVCDELRDYRFYAPNMLHPSEQAVDYIYERFCQCYLSSEAERIVAEWRPIKAALDHRPFNPDGEDYKAFRAKTQERLAEFERKYKLTFAQSKG